MAKKKQEQQSCPEQDAEIQSEAAEEVCHECEDGEKQQLKEQAESYKQMAQRIQAEFDNYRRRSLEDAKKKQELAVIHTASAILPAIDSVEEAVKAYSGDESKAELKDGFEKVLKQMLEALASIGVKQMDCLGKEFDPNLHEAMLTQESDDAKSGEIITVFRNGYVRNDLVIRHAQVIVAK